MQPPQTSERPAEAPPPATPVAPTIPKPPATVSLQEQDSDLPLPQLPAFQMPQPPPPLPPKPGRPPAPRTFSNTTPRSPSGFPLPQNWSLSTGPTSLLGPRGTDQTTNQRGSQSDASYRHLAGADPGADWAAELHRWAAEHSYYPPQAVQNGEYGTATVQLTIDRYGHVLTVDLVDRSGSPWLDMAWLGEWRHATVPRFPPGTPEDTTTILYTIHYILVRRR